MGDGSTAGQAFIVDESPSPSLTTHLVVIAMKTIIIYYHIFSFVKTRF